MIMFLKKTGTESIISSGEKKRRLTSVQQELLSRIINTQKDLQ